VHDFVDVELGKVVPYGVCDIAANAGCAVSASTTTQRNSRSTRSAAGWDVMGRERYPDAVRVMITADGGGSNGSRVRLFKVELQKLADETGLTLQVCHFPPGTSKWNKIEHRLFCHITQTWRGKPLTSRLAVVELIAATTTNTGLLVRCELDPRAYPKGIKVSDAEMDTLNIKGNAFHPEWNYTIAPRVPP
jgi:hypothetical protein